MRWGRAVPTKSGHDGGEEGHAAAGQGEQSWCHPGLVGRSGGSDIGYEEGKGDLGHHHGQVVWRMRTFPAPPLT